MARRSRKTLSNGVRVLELPRSAVVAEVTAELKESGLSIPRFVQLGKAGELEDDRLRDLWMMAGPALTSR